MTVKKKVTSKKRIVKKKPVMGHDPLSMLDEETGASTQENESLAVKDSVQSSEKIEPEVQVMNEQEGVVSSNESKIIDLETKFTMSIVEEKKLEFSQLLDEGSSILLNGEDVDQIDGGGLQLLVAFFKDAEVKHVDIQWKCVSKVFSESVHTIGLTDVLKMAEVEVIDSGEGETWGLF